ncbi:MAG: putative membrane protein YdbT with pleckstrin-like domain, partial [Kiritimatiellia bacterium]
MNTAARELKPRRMSFMIPRVVGTLVLLVVLSIAVLVTALVMDVLAFVALVPVLCLVVGLPALFAAHVAYTKERYEIHAEHLVCHRGSLLSDGRTELDVRNITHVRLRLPWIRHKLFGIGDVRVESAGSSASEITFQSVVAPEATFQEIQDLMRDNGYSMQKREVLHEESPGFVGALTHVVQVGLGAVVAVMFALVGFGGLIGEFIAEGGWFILAPLLGLGFVVVLVVFGGVLIVRFLDMTRRTYTVYDDAVTYTEGFLTRNNAVIPFENIADASANRTVVDQVLGLYDVKVSCQGSGSEIVFRRLARGEELSKAIGTLVANASDRAQERVDSQAAASEPTGAPAEGARRTKPLAKRQRVGPKEAWTADLKMNALRAQLPVLLLLPAFPLWVAAAVAVLV